MVFLVMGLLSAGYAVFFHLVLDCFKQIIDTFIQVLGAHIIGHYDSVHSHRLPMRILTRQLDLLQLTGLITSAVDLRQDLEEPIFWSLRLHLNRRNFRSQKR